jgi:hypothetical protein
MNIDGIEPKFVNISGAQESIPPGWNRFLNSLESILRLLKGTHLTPE